MSYMVITEEEKSRILGLYYSYPRQSITEQSLGSQIIKNLNQATKLPQPQVGIPVKPPMRDPNMPVLTGQEQDQEGITFDKFMEGFREKLFSPAGAAAEVALASFPPTTPAVVIAYGAMLTYDIVKSVQDNVTNWFNIICDALGLISTGVLAGTMSGWIGFRNSFKTLDEVLIWFKNSKLWAQILPWLQKISSGIGTLIANVNKGIEWLINRTSLTTLKNIAGKIVSFLKSIGDKVTKFISEAPARTIKAVETGTEMAKAYGQDKAVDVASNVMTGTDTAGNIVQKPSSIVRGIKNM